MSNKNCANINDAAEIYMALKTNTIYCKLTHFGNYGHLLIKIGLFLRHESNIRKEIRCFLWHQISLLENITLNKPSKKI